MSSYYTPIHSVNNSLKSNRNLEATITMETNPSEYTGMMNTWWTRLKPHSSDYLLQAHAYFHLSGKLINAKLNKKCDASASSAGQPKNKMAWNKQANAGKNMLTDQK